MPDRTESIAAVYGGGGLFGIAFTLAVCEALQDHTGINLADTPTLGTSAGSWAAAHLTLGIPAIDSLTHIGDNLRIPDLRPGRLARIANELFGPDTILPNVTVAACPLRGDRHLLGGEHRIRDLVAASSAVPGVFSPHRINRRLYIDGGIRSMTSADLTDDADRLLAVMPIAGPMLGPAGRFLEHRSRNELDDWQTRNPTSRISIIRPPHRIAEHIHHPLHLFDAAKARDCYHRAYDWVAAHIAPGWHQPAEAAA